MNKTTLRYFAFLFIMCTSPCYAYEMLEGAYARERGPSVLKVKGLYVGMDIEEAWRIVRTLLNEAYIIGPIDPNKGLPRNYKYSLKPKDPTTWLQAVYIYAGPDRKVLDITIPSELVGVLFNAGDIGPRDFAQEFINAYKIPNMELYIDFGKEQAGWRFTSSFGYEVTIDSTRSIQIRSVSSTEKLNFN